MLFFYSFFKHNKKDFAIEFLLNGLQLHILFSSMSQSENLRSSVIANLDPEIHRHFVRVSYDKQLKIQVKELFHNNLNIM